MIVVPELVEFLMSALDKVMFLTYLILQTTFLKHLGIRTKGNDCVIVVMSIL